MGDDSSVVQAARISYGEGTKTVSDDEMLIRYLMRHRHTTPSEMCELKLHLRVPMDDHRQIVRHRTASINEYSTRYSDVIKMSRKTRPKEWRLQSQNNKQGSQAGDVTWPEGYELRRLEEGSKYGAVYFKGKAILAVDDVDNFTPAIYLSRVQSSVHRSNHKFYEELRLFGIAREQARQNIVISTYTEYYWKIDVHNLFHFLKLRMDSHAQWEIQQYAHTIAGIVQKWLPLSWQAFEEYVLNAITLTMRDQTVMRHLLCGRVDLALEVAKSYGWGKSSRERKEFCKKMAAIGGPNPWSRRWT
jgi:thymidylate synthase (FAD)